MLFTVSLLTLAASGINGVLDTRTSQSTAKPSCSLPGYGAQSGGELGYYRYLSNTNIAACQELCRRDSECHSFSSYDKGGSGNCYLYKSPADQVIRTSYPDYSVSDKSCNLGNELQECFLPGYGGAVIGINGFLEVVENVKVSICRSHCDAHPECNSFSGRDDDASTCYLYSWQAENIARVELVGYVIYAQGCSVNAAPKCNLAGWGSLSGGQFGYYRSVTGKSLAGCQTECRQDISCRAFCGITGTASTGNCYLYSVPADYVYRTSYSTYDVFDLRCSISCNTVSEV